MIDPRTIPGSLVHVESSRDHFTSTWLVLGPSRDGRDVRVVRSTEPTDALVLSVDAFVPVSRCALAVAPDPALVLLICWFDFAAGAWT